MGYFTKILTGKSEIAVEALGTFLFVLVGTSAITALNVVGQGTTPQSLLVGFIAFTSVLGWLVYAFGSQHAAHFNPIFTILALFEGQVSLGRSLWLMLSQFSGALAASVMVALLYGTAGVETKLGAPYPMTAMGDWAALAAEFIGSMIFLTAARRALSAPSAPQKAVMISIGFGMGYLLAAGISGGSLNPARALAPQLAAADLTGWWIYVAGPVAAAVIVGMLSRLAPSETDAPAKAIATQLLSQAIQHEPVVPTTTPAEPELQQKAEEDLEDLKAAEEETTLPFTPAAPSFYVDSESEETEDAAPPQPEDTPAPVLPHEPQPQPVSRVKFINFENKDDNSES